MLTSFAAIFFILLAAASVSVFTNRKIDDCWPACISGIVLWLYGFYCLGGLWFGTKLLCIGVILLFVLAWKRLGSLRSIVTSVLTPGTACYLVMCGLFVLFFSQNHVTLHDELRLWAAVPKAMHVTGRLQLGENAIIFPIMHSYPPGLPLVLYFFTFFSEEFSEGALYVGYACVTMAFFIPVFSNWKWKNWPLTVYAGTVIFLIPFFFTSHFCDLGLFGKTLFVDPLLGVLAGFVFCQAGNKPFKTWFDCISFSLVAVFLCLCKKTGLVFALAAVLCAVYLDKGKHKARVLLPFFLVGAAYGGWYILQTLYAVSVPRPLEVHALGMGEIRNVIQALFTENVIAYRVPLGVFGSFIGVYGILWVIYYWILHVTRQKNSSDKFLVNVAMLVSTVLFIYGYALLYAQELESFARYMATPLLCLCTCIILDGVPVFIQSKKARFILDRLTVRKHIILCLGAGLCCCVFLCVWSMIFPELEQMDEMDAAAERIRTAVLENKESDENAWIYAVIAGDGYENSHRHHRMFFDMISADINIRNGLAQTQVVDPGIEDPASAWAEELKRDYNFVYLLSVEDALIPVFAEFTEDPAEPGALYRVVPADNEYGVALMKQ